MHNGSWSRRNSHSNRAPVPGINCPAGAVKRRYSVHRPRYIMCKDAPLTCTSRPPVSYSSSPCLSCHLAEQFIYARIAIVTTACVASQDGEGSWDGGRAAQRRGHGQQ